MPDSSYFGATDFQEKHCFQADNARNQPKAGYVWFNRVAGKEVENNNNVTSDYFSEQSANHNRWTGGGRYR